MVVGMGRGVHPAGKGSTWHRATARTPGAGRAQAACLNKFMPEKKNNFPWLSPENPIRPPSLAPSPENGASSKAFAFS